MKSVHRQITTMIENDLWDNLIPDKQMRHDVWAKIWNVVEDIDTHKILTILEVEKTFTGK